MKNIKLRPYSPADITAVTGLFYNTVHTVNRRDYTDIQLDTWADGNTDLDKWTISFQSNITVIAEIAEIAEVAEVAEVDSIIVGFGDITHDGYLDRLYVHKDYQHIGIATAICDYLESRIDSDKTITHASITARPFFEKRGYVAVKEQQVIRHNVALTNFIMEKQI